MSARRFNILCIVGIAGILVCVLLLVVSIDPDFHYHAPKDGRGYSLNNERYQNDGIVRNFNYNAIITGTSVTENFKVSECNTLFGVNAVKVAFAGAYYKEINDNLIRAFSSDNEIEIVIRSLDYSGDYLVCDKDKQNSELRDESVYPTYLYDNNLFNDSSYVWNKSILISSLVVLKNKLVGEDEISFDDYANWNERYTFGKPEVVATFSRSEEIEEPVQLSDEEIEMVRGNIRQNVIELAKQHPETTFYLFFPPYSICYWDTAYREGKLEYILKAKEIAIEELLPYSNIKLFSFDENEEWICNLENYKDRVHYGEWINTEILKDMCEGRNQLTESNYVEHLNKIRDFYTTYNYDIIYQ